MTTYTYKCARCERTITLNTDEPMYTCPCGVRHHAPRSTQ